MLRCSATRAMTRTLHEPWPRPKRPPSARDPPSQSAAPPENRRVNQPETVSRLRKGHGAANMALVRHFALNLVRTATDRRSLKTRRKRASWDHPYLQALLSPLAR